MLLSSIPGITIQVSQVDLTLQQALAPYFIASTHLRFVLLSTVRDCRLR